MDKDFILFDDENSIMNFITLNFGDINTDYIRIGFCPECRKINFIDPPGGPFTKVPSDCKCNKSEDNNV